MTQNRSSWIPEGLPCHFISFTSLLLYRNNTGPEVIKLFPCSIQLIMKFILLINVKMPTIVGILTFISIIKTIFERLNAKKLLNLSYEQLKLRA